MVFTRRDSPFSPEFQLLLHCGLSLDRDTNEASPMEASAIDWPVFLGMARRHRVIPHAYRALRAPIVKDVPNAVIARLEDLNRSNARRNLVVAGELAKIGRHFNRHAIPVLALKGPVLATQLYGDITRRQFRDLDILVPPEHIPGAATLLNEFEFHEAHMPLSTLSNRQRARVMECCKHITFTNPTLQLDVELHWRLASDDRHLQIEPDRLWRERVPFGGAEIHVLPPLASFVYLAWHGSEHRWKRLSWLFDFSRALTGAQYGDSRQFLEAAARFGVLKYAVLALALHAHIAGRHVELPPDTLKHHMKASVERAVEVSLHALQADAMFYENQPLSGLIWRWRMDDSRWSALSLLEIFSPQPEDAHRPPPVAFAKRLQHICARSVRHFL